ncbi:MULTISPECIES: glycosyltransferase [Sphingomonas]|uniref:Chitooligosaccharide deacetylase n=1 Tax=Sphingomonas zeae TaxID=1646122 RepID=A0A7Y6EGL3_9SPHN|nr:MULTISPECIES: glycosyltransferase [Sphingomonas]MBB4047445.1 peptidoglycan/xylan/chitin deacetylase (PgdA/CDA1 family)/spore germination protein YaaH/GT2 family glycosyltransferase [Sphingomonas zeae]MDK8185195.1 glycosyltransferase [Sphingomonas zeae]MDK8214862.1 glycosyltransferase [Sphingomonas sp. UMB7805-LC452B]NUU48589.1 glycosyltransferase [Sphingomonas zeae]
MTNPIFFDPTGRRGAWARRAVAVTILAVVVAAIAFATTLVAVPNSGVLPLPFARRQAMTLEPTAQLKGRRGAWLPRKAVAQDHTPLTIAFYTPGNDSALASLHAHMGQIDWLVPGLMNVAGPKGQLTISNDPKLATLLSRAAKPPRLLPMVQNLSDDEWDGQTIARIIASPAASEKLATQLGQSVTVNRQSGLVIDFENLPASAMLGYPRLLQRIKAHLPKGTVLAVTVPAEDEAWELTRLAKVADRIILMAYDQHWQTGTPGPIAAQPWFLQASEKALREVGRDKLIVALGSYGYDWPAKGPAESKSIEEAWLIAHDSQAKVTFDQASGNAGFAYDENGEHHTVWMLDAATSWNQLEALKRLGIDDVAFWQLGSEDPGLWADFAAFRSAARGVIPRLGTIVSPLNVDVEGTGEILRITAQPTQGERGLQYDKDGVIRNEVYRTYPTPYVVQRAGALPKTIALTFDDGPDAEWTPKILDVLEREHVPATFFVIGENALQHPQLLRRIVAGGSELGNHSYTHPNMATTGERTIKLELNATKRLIQAYTGRSTTLFRAPYFGDAEPTTADEIDPALVAQNLGYTVVGLHVDPNDWQRPGTDEIVRQTIDQVHGATPDNSANVVLLHDGGGDREQTVEALPRIIDTLRAEGYRFVPASQLVGVSRDQAMPLIEGHDLLAVRTDVAIFVVLALLSAGLAWLFYLAIALGIARAVVMAGLAWFQGRKSKPVPPAFTPSVSVIIPAFNEERVIVQSVSRVLASDYPGLQIIVADDGSKDGTSAVVREAFANEPRVRLLTLVNGGKAAALNRALQDATGEVVIALDADTQFEPETIAKLARWFADPKLGAVAGDARVGNRVNLVTRWQAVEYITAQNLERRALAGFDAMTVVPGAVGAWRRAALDSVGGYPEDTLAEDQDLTIAIQRAGWRVTYDPRAVAWTEAPESFRALAKQRYRWAFGTLQCLWKHRGVLRTGKPAGLARIGLPQAWLFQILFAAISPLIDLALILSIIGTAVRVGQHGWAQTHTDVFQMAAYWTVFTSVDILCGWLAYRLDGNRVRYPAHLLVAQRLVYRQIMYWVVIRAIASAIGGWIVGWGKLERTGNVGA